MSTHKKYILKLNKKRLLFLLVARTKWIWIGEEGRGERKKREKSNDGGKYVIWKVIK